MFTPKYRITDEIARYLSDIAEIRSVVSHAKLIPVREFSLRRIASIKLAHSSTSIEGNSLEEYQVQKLMEGNKIIGQKDEIREVENYFRALHLVDQLAQKTKITPRHILSLQKAVISGLVEDTKVGAFRTGPIYIVNRDRIVYTGPSASEVGVLINNLCDWLANAWEIHPVIRAGLLHYQFVTIHPFTDGNGRTARLLTLLHLYQSGWDFRKSLVLDEVYNNNRLGYYAALQTASKYQDRESTDLTNWLTYFVKGFWESSLKLKEQILSLQVGAGDISSRHLSVDELKIVDFVLTLGRISSSDVVDILNIPKRTAQFKLKKLESYLILQKVGSGPATYYVLAKTD